MYRDIICELSFMSIHIFSILNHYQIYFDSNMYGYIIVGCCWIVLGSHILMIPYEYIREVKQTNIKKSDIILI